MPRGLTTPARLATAIIVLAVLPGRADDELNRGQADVGFQGYYLGQTSHTLSDTSGTAMHFTDLMPAVGVWSGSVELYGQDGGFQPGNNYLRISDLLIGGRRWTASAGDFVAPIGTFETGLPNIMLPPIQARGFFGESVHRGESWSFFAGRETLTLGPGIPLRAAAPQTVIAAAWKRTFRDYLQVDVRLLDFSSSAEELERSAVLFPGSTGYRNTKTGTLQILGHPFQHVRTSAEISESRSVQPRGGVHLTPSAIAGLTLDTGKLQAAADYVSTSAAWLPIAGYYLGARQGGFGDIRYRPFRRLSFSADGGNSTSTISSGAGALTFRTETASA